MTQWTHVTIARLWITNFKRFYGAHEVNLLSRPEEGKPIVLIGGENGRGKTSIHEAINYVFYEDGDLPGIQTRPSYLRAVSERLNRRALDEARRDYSVALELLVSGGDAQRRLRIERRWDVDISERKALRPVLIIEENGRLIDWIEDDPAAYQDFLRQILPPRIAPFFFFDGERIQEFAQDESHDRNFIEAMEDILHITVYKTLRNDLRKHVIEHVERYEMVGADTSDYYRLQGDVERIERELEAKRDRQAEVDNEIGEDRRRQRAVEDELRRIAGPYATQRDELITEKHRLEAELDGAKNDMQEGFEAIPVLLAGEVGRLLNSALHELGTAVVTGQRVAAMRRQLDLVRSRVFESPEPPPPPEMALAKEQVAYFCRLFAAVTEEVFGLCTSGRAVHDLSEGERVKALQRLDEAASKARLLRDAIDRRERASSELREVETKLYSTSDDPHVKELIEDSRAISESIGRLRGEGESLAAEIQRLEADLASGRNQVVRSHEQREATSQAQRAVKLARKAHRVLDDFIKRLAPEKLAIVQREFGEMYGRLRKPEDPWRSIDIDPDSWNVILKDERGRPLERRVFSAGMREMYALALLWALARASGRQLPIVIDTPLARLDSANRTTLSERYLPHAGHQVIVLSHDREVDPESASRLQPYVAQQYRLDYDRETDSTVIRPGYFF